MTEASDIKTPRSRGFAGVILFAILFYFTVFWLGSDATSAFGISLLVALPFALACVNMDMTFPRRAPADVVWDAIITFPQIQPNSTRLTLPTQYHPRTLPNGCIRLWGSLFSGDNHRSIWQVIKQRSELMP